MHLLLGRCGPDSTSGVHQAVYQLTQAQAALGGDIELHTLSDSKQQPVPGVEVQTHRPTAIPFMLPRSLTRLIRTRPPSLVHLHSVYIPANAALGRLLRRRRIPYVTTPHGGFYPAILRRRAFLKRPYRVLFELPLQNGAAFVHAIADEGDIRSYGVTSPIIIAPNGIDRSRLPTRPDRELLSRRHPRLRGRRVFLFLGRLDPKHKGLDLLLQAFAQASLEDAALVLVGPDHHGGRDELSRMARSLGIEDQILLTGPVLGDERFSILSGADVFVHPSRWEAGVPLSVLEAAAVGLPCMLTRRADPSGQLLNSGAALTTKADVSSLSESLQALAAQSKRDLQRMGGRGALLVGRRFTWGSTARRLLHAYRQAAGRSG